MAFGHKCTSLGRSIEHTYYEKPTPGVKDNAYIAKVANESYSVPQAAASVD
jgi:hypothetical protein